MQRAVSTKMEGPEVSASLVVSMGIEAMEANDAAEKDVTSEMEKGDRGRLRCAVWHMEGTLHLSPWRILSKGVARCDLDLLLSAKSKWQS